MFNELRIHGVSGTPPRDMLYTDPVTESTPDDYTKIYRNPGTPEGFDSNAVAFHWGGLTAGSWHTAFWILLAPFALANVAGWMLWKRNRVTVAGVRVAGVALTALFVSQTLTAAVVAHGWFARLELTGWMLRLATVVLLVALLSFVFWVTGLLSIRSHFTPLTFWCRVRLLLWPSREWLQQPEPGDECRQGSGDDWSDPAFANRDTKPPSPDVVSSPWVADERLWAPHSIMHRTRRCHFAVSMAILSIGLSRALGADWVFWSGIVMLVFGVGSLILTTVAAEQDWVVNLTAWVAPVAFLLSVFITSASVFDPVPSEWPGVHSTNLVISIAFGVASFTALLFGAGKAVGALAFAAFFGGAMGIAAVTVLERLTGVPGSLAAEPAEATYLANGAGWVAVWMLVVVLVLIGVASFVSFLPLEREPDPPLREPEPLGLTRTQKARLKRARKKAVRRREMLIRLRRVINEARTLLWSIVVVGVAVGVGLAGFLCRSECDPANLKADSWGLIGWLLIGTVIALGIALWPLGGWIRVAVPLATLGVLVAAFFNFLTFRVLKVQVNLTRLADASLAIAVLIPAVWILNSIIGGVRDGEKRRKTGLLWDVASFWPRYFHPLSPPPYGPNAIHDLMDELGKHEEKGEKLILSAHSQGSVVATVALSQLDVKRAGVVTKMITYGSPISLIYSRLFKEAGLHTLVETKAGMATMPWYNLWRRTDYLGGMPLPIPDAGANFEADGLGHSGYECTRQFRQVKSSAWPVEPGDENMRCGARP